MAHPPSDVLTALQTTLDQLLTQFFSSLSYLSQRHPLVPPTAAGSTDPYTNPPTEPHSSHPGAEDTSPPYPLQPRPASEFAAAQAQLAEDLVIKGQQIEALIRRLPRPAPEGQREKDIEALVARVREMETRRREKRSEMRQLVARLDRVVEGMAESIGGESRNINGASGT